MSVVLQVHTLLTTFDGLEFCAYMCDRVSLHLKAHRCSEACLVTAQEESLMMAATNTHMHKNIHGKQL